jgi:hypothetical protein
MYTGSIEQWEYPKMSSKLGNDWLFRPLVNKPSLGLAIGYFEKKKFPVYNLQAASNHLTFSGSVIALKELYSLFSLTNRLPRW